MERPPILLSISGYEPLQRALCAELSGELGEVERRRFPDGEAYQRLVSSVTDREVVLVGGTISDGATLELYDLASAVVKYGALRLIMVVPYFGYSTMERAVKSGEVVTAKTRARLLSAIPPAAFNNQLLLLDLHSEGIAHYFEGGVTARHVRSWPILQPLLQSFGPDVVLGSTDTGRAKWVEGMANALGVEYAIILKRRVSGEQTRVMAVNAQVRDRTVVIYDDMIRTGSSLLNAGRAYRDAGARELIAVCTHGVFPGDAFARLRDSGLFSRLISTDSHPRASALVAEGLEVVPVAPLFAAQLAG